MSEENESIELEVHTDGELYAGVSAPRKAAWSEAMHYARGVGDSPRVEIFEVKRNLMWSKPSNSSWNELGR